MAPRLGDYTVVAPPSISAARIDQVLASYGSPASGSGALFYDLGVKYGIDPAYALAFYINESAAGTKGVARFTHGIGNIRTTPGYADYEGYRSYPDFATGIEDWYKLIKELYVDGWGLTTPDAIIARYAPWGDNNNPEAYAHTVEQLVELLAGVSTGRARGGCCCRYWRTRRTRTCWSGTTASAGSGRWAATAGRSASASSTWRAGGMRRCCRSRPGRARGRAAGARWSTGWPRRCPNAPCSSC